MGTRIDYGWADGPVVRAGSEGDRTAGPDGLRAELDAVEAIAGALAQLPNQKVRERVMRWAREYVREIDGVDARTTEPTASTPASILRERTDQVPPAVVQHSEPALAVDDVEVLFDKSLPPPTLQPERHRKKKPRRVASLIPRVVASLRKRTLQVAMLLGMATSKFS